MRHANQRTIHLSPAAVAIVPDRTGAGPRINRIIERYDYIRMWAIDAVIGRLEPETLNAWAEKYNGFAKSGGGPENDLLILSWAAGEVSQALLEMLRSWSHAEKFAIIEWMESKRS